MFLFRICMMALGALRSNLLRSLLATLGVIIGVAAVISAMSILEGATRDIMNTIQSFGADQVIVWPARTRAGGRALSLPGWDSSPPCEQSWTKCGVELWPRAAGFTRSA